MTGSGIFTVPGTILNSVGSIGVALLYWVLAPLFALCGLALYSELASMFPNRSGAEVVFLEKAYPRPKYFVSTVFAVSTIFTSFTVTNAVVFAQYFLNGLGLSPTPITQTRVAIGVLLATTTLVATSTKLSLNAVKLLSTMKVLSLVFVVATGAAVLLGITVIKNPYDNFRQPFEGTSSSFNALALALVKANYSFVGWHNAFNVLAEIKGQDPVRTARKAGRIALALIATLFFFINIAYAAAVPKEEIKNSGQLVAALFFQHVYGNHWGGRILSFLVALSCFGNLIAVTVGQTRLIREVARQGLLPYPNLLSSTQPFGTPLGPVAIKGGISMLLILLIPAKDTFNFVLNLAAYPNYLFQGVMVVGVWLLRRRRKVAGLAPSPLQARNALIVIFLLACLLLLIMPW
ncbi:High-affinity methionine permease [Leucoagaricus sp. SymC.cos]|nr:High-affinity methionine permease [Leucoagaricus sp. SymC.cos]